MEKFRSPFHRILQWPSLYNLSQTILGAKRARRKLIRKIILPKTGETVLDFGCGTGSILKYLPSGIAYYGCDINKSYLREAKLKFGSRGYFFHFSLNDSIPEKFLAKFDCVLGIGLLHHLNDNEVFRFLKMTGSLLNKKGKLITYDPVIHDNQSAIARFLVLKDRGLYVRSPEGYEKLIETEFSRIQGSIHTHMLYVPYSHFISVSSKSRT